MSPDRWQKIEELFHAARARPLSERPAFLTSCAIDGQLRREIETLLDDSASDDGFVDRPAAAAVASMSGRFLGGYRLQALLGSGGMGEVYQAHDSKLGRPVAIKILPQAWSRDPDRLARFEREARMLAALNHPNVCGIYGLEEAAGVQFLVLEMMDGITLAQKLAEREGLALALSDTLQIARQLAEGLEAAHDAGIVHRDLKPANIGVKAGGVVKILDFGLAKTVGGDGTSAGLTQAPGVALAGGAIIGTAAYMSPEQARGLPVDKRTDIWAFGCVLYEMMTGRIAFAGETASDSIARILEREPDWSALPPATPAPVQRILLRCLTKDPRQRLRDIGEARIALDGIEDEPAGTLPAAPAPPVAREDPTVWPSTIGRYVRVTAFLVGLAIIVGGIAALYGRRQESTGPSLVSATFTRLTSDAGIEQHPSLSPDGKWFVYAAPVAKHQHIFLQSVGGQKRFDISEDGSDDSQPAFSPDGEVIAFRSERLGGGVFVMGRTGELRRRITDSGFNPAWSPDGREIMFTTEIMTTNPYNRTGGVSALWAVRVADGVKRQIYSGDVVQPTWSPHGRRIAFWTVQRGRRDVWTIPAGGGEPLAVTSDAAVDFNPIWSPDGRYLLFSSDRGGTPNLWRVPINEMTGEVQGPPEPLTTNSAWVADLTIAADGHRIAYTSLTLSSNIQRFDFDPDTGSVTGPGRWVTTGSAFRKFMDVSPDSLELVVSSGMMQEDLVVIAADGSRMRQLTDDVALDRRPTWSPDGQRIAFESTRGGAYQIWEMNGDGSGLRPLTDDPDYTFVYHAWSPTGDRMFTTSATTWNALIFDPRRPFKDQRATPLPRAPSGQFSATSWSPDGRRLVGWTADGIAIYDLESRSYEVLTKDRAMLPQWLGSDSIIYPRESSLILLDLVTKRSRELLSTAPEVIRYIALSRDKRHLYVARGAEEADIWMARID